MKYIRLMRIKHWVKNLLIILPLICSGMISQIDRLTVALIGFVSFSLLASTIYIMNDIVDVEADRMHEKKRKRPIASGEITISRAKMILCVLGVISLILAIYIGIHTELLLPICGCWLGYFFVNICYSICGLKNIPVMDVFLLVLCYYIRVLFGSVITGVEMSSWLYLVIISGAFYLGFGKRKGELICSPTRKVMESYSMEFLQLCTGVSMALSIVFYSLWAVMKESAQPGDLTQGFLLSIPILLLIFFRYEYLISKGSGGDPMESIFADKATVLLIIVFVVLFATGIYL